MFFLYYNIAYICIKYNNTMARNGENISIYAKYIDKIDEKIANKEYVSRSDYYNKLAEVDLQETREDKILDKFNSK